MSAIYNPPNQSTNFIPSNPSANFNPSDSLAYFNPSNPSANFNPSDSSAHICSHDPYTLPTTPISKTQPTIPVQKSVTPSPNSIRNISGICCIEQQCIFTCSRLTQLKKHLTNEHKIELNETIQHFQSNAGKQIPFLKNILRSLFRFYALERKL